MTSDPQRLLQGTSADDDATRERDLLRSILDVSPPPHAQGAAWDGIATKIAAASVAAAGATVAARAASSAAHGAAAANGVAPPIASGIGHALASKLLVGTIVAAAGVAAVGGAWIEFGARPSTTRSASQPQRDAPHVVAVAPSVVPVAPSVVAEPQQLLAPVVPDAPSAPRPAERPRPDDGLALEGALLTDARASLRAGDPARALAVLRKLDRQFPRGALGQEREVLTIEALSALGDTAEARRRADAFVKAHPNSPHSPLLHRLTSSP